MWQLNNGALCTPEFLILAGLFYLSSLPFSEQIIVLFRLLGFLCHLLFGSYSHSSLKPASFHSHPWYGPIHAAAHQRPNRFIFRRQNPSMCWGGAPISDRNSSPSPRRHANCIVWSLALTSDGNKAGLSATGVTLLPRKDALVSICPGCCIQSAWRSRLNIMFGNLKNNNNS